MICRFYKGIEIVGIGVVDEGLVEVELITGRMLWVNNADITFRKFKKGVKSKKGFTKELVDTLNRNLDKGRFINWDSVTKYIAGIAVKDGIVNICYFHVDPDNYDLVYGETSIELDIPLRVVIDIWKATD